MSQLRRRDNERELSLRRALHAHGLRFRVTYPVPALRRRTIDIAFTRWRVAVFLDGCFWHGCPLHGTDPRSNSTWWKQKIDANRARDLDTDEHLSTLGWTSVRIWEHEDLHAACDRVLDVLIEARAQSALVETNSRAPSRDGSGLGT